MQRTATREFHHVRMAPFGISAASLWVALRTRISETRCRMFHSSISLPVKGKYRCWQCLHEFDTDW
jgi:hypothetical protein